MHTPVVVKADVKGSSEALVDALSDLRTDYAAVEVIRSGAGRIVSCCACSWRRLLHVSVRSGVCCLSNTCMSVPSGIRGLAAQGLD